MTKLAFHPIGDRVLVKIVMREELSPRSVPTATGREATCEGEVVAVGVGRLGLDGQRIRPELKRGDRVLLDPTHGRLVQLDGTPYVLLRENQVFGVISYRVVTS